MSNIMADLNLDASLTLKIIFCGHFSLTTVALFGMSLGSAYTFYNAFLLVFLLWAQTETVEKSDFPLFYSIIVNVQAILFDVLMLSNGYALVSGVARFGFAMCIINMLARFPSTFLLYRIREQRRVLTYQGGNPQQPGAATTPMSGYEDLPSSYPSGVPRHTGAGADARPLPP